MVNDGCVNRKISRPEKSGWWSGPLYGNQGFVKRLFPLKNGDLYGIICGFKKKKHPPKITIDCMFTIPSHGW